MKKPKSNSGITLIALIITIIVLLILAGVSISLVAGQNGVLNKAQTAVTETNKSKLEEEVQFILSDWQTDYLVSKIPYDGRSETTPSGAVVSCTGNNISVVAESVTYTATLNNGQIGELIEESTDVNSQAYKAMHPIIPEGFTHTEGEWNTGFVIKDGNNDEFVWIPIVSSTVYSRKSGSRNWNMTAQHVDDCGKDVTQYILGDKLGVTEILGTTITETERTGETPANIPEAEIVNNAGGFYVSRYEIGIDNAERTTGSQLDSRNESTVYYSQRGKEPARKISQTDSLDIANRWKMGSNYQSGLITGTEWDAMCNFIGWSTCDGDCTTWGNHININSKAYTDGEVWHAPFQKDGGLELWTNTAVTKGNRNIAADVDKTDRMVFATGTFVNKDGGSTMKKNIYDVAGNVWEWTTEVPTQNNNHRVVRGGSADDSGHDALATNRAGDLRAIEMHWLVGFRAVLYVK